MSSKKKIEDKLNEALQGKGQEYLSNLKISCICDKRSEIAGRTKGQKEILDSDITAILKRMIKQRNESCEVYKKAGRNELLENENKEIQVINTFLPKQLERRY